MARKAKVIRELDSSQRWLVTFSDLMSLLLCFFILLFAFSQADLDRFSKLTSSLRAAFNGVEVFTGGVGFGDTMTAAGTQDPSSNMINMGSLPTARQNAYQQIATEVNQHALANQIQNEIAVNIGKEGIYISLSSALLYPSGSTELGESGKQTLLTIAQLLNGIPNSIRVEAHTDDTPTGSPIYATNWDLSSARAVSVVRYLTDAGQVNPERMAAVGLAQYRPLYPNDTPERRRLNRRADILILYPPEEEPPVIDLGFP